MTPAPPVWSATVRLRPPSGEEGSWLARALAPEAAREVPRASAGVKLDGGGSVELTVEARDAGALRAALNTYLGWIELAVATLDASTGGPPA